MKSPPEQLPAGSSRRRLSIRGLLLAALVLALIFILPVLMVRAAVTLVRFEAEPADTQIMIEWETASELDNAGFYVLRNQTGGTNWSNYTRIEVVDAENGTVYTPPALIPARGDSIIGDIYTFYDQNVSAQVEYFYVLEAVDTNNLSQFHGPISTGIGLATDTPTPTQTSSESPTPTRTMTPTSSATSVQNGTPANGTSTATVPATASITAAPTQTGGPTLTASPTRTSTPGPTATQGPTLRPSGTPVADLDASLTAVMARVTPLGTSAQPDQVTSPTSTAAAVVAEVTLPPVSAEETFVASTGLILRILLTCFLFAVSGTILTGGVIYFVYQRGN